MLVFVLLIYCFVMADNLSPIGYEEYDDDGIDELEHNTELSSDELNTDDLNADEPDDVIDPFIVGVADKKNEVGFAPTSHSHKPVINHTWLFRSQLAVNESEKEFSYFNSFIELGGGRSIQYIATLFNLQHSTIYNIYKKNNWKLRAADYDRYMLAEKIKLSQDARQREHMMKLETYRQEQECIGRQLSMNAAKIAQIANNTLNRIIEGDTPIEIRDIPGLLNTAAKVADIGKQLQSSALGVDQLLAALEEADID